MAESRRVLVVDDDPDHSLRSARARFESDHIRRILEENDWQIQRTASVLKITRLHLWKKMQEYGIGRPEAGKI